ncbi:MAG: AAA family ATPase [Treponema sp.]|nr:AAA family ATPase [Treponema sp.]
MNIGICFGGYSPMHQGHLDLIMKSKKLNDFTHVIVCGYGGDPRGELLPLEKRYNIIRNFLQEETVAVHMINDTKLGLDESMSQNNWRVWLGEVEKFVWQTPLLKNEDSWIDTVNFYVAEERYVSDINNAIKNFGAFPSYRVRVNFSDRNENLISGTMCRSNPIKSWFKITQPFRAYYSHNILITGTASEGKTTLTRDIGKYFGIPYSYEKGRDICHLKKDTEFNFKDFLYNITEQNRYNEELICSPQNPGVFISDTDNMVTLMYAAAYKEREGFSIGKEEYKVLYEVAEQYAKTIKWNKIFLIKPHKKPIVDDGERYMPDSAYNIRVKFYNNLKKLYEAFGYEFEELDGNYYENFCSVRDYIRSIGFQN